MAAPSKSIIEISLCREIISAFPSYLHRRSIFLDTRNNRREEKCYVCDKCIANEMKRAENHDISSKSLMAKWWLRRKSKKGYLWKRNHFPLEIGEIEENVEEEEYRYFVRNKSQMVKATVMWLIYTPENQSSIMHRKSRRNGENHRNTSKEIKKIFYEACTESITSK